MTDKDGRQPYLHDLLACVRAPALALSAHDCQISGPGVAGIYLSDRRIISRSILGITGAQLCPVLGEFAGAGGTRSVSILRGLGDPGPDPSVWLHRLRRVHGSGAGESIEINSAARRTVRTSITLELGCDLAAMAAVKAGLFPAGLAATALPDGLRWQGADGCTVTATARPAPDRLDAEAGALHWDIQLGHGERARIELTFEFSGDPTPQVVQAPEGDSQLPVPTVAAGDRRLASLIEQSVADLVALELADPRQPEDHFIAAGIPWFLTLFGRDSLITARMLLPLGTEIAAGTLRTLARRQGSTLDLDSAEEPGKILHEIRRAESVHPEASHAGHAMRLPPTYYGTVDATPLWVLLLHDSWRWGLAEEQVQALLPNLERALAWMRDYGMADNGFLSYADRSGHGLANQGWKDSHDSIQFRDGRLAAAPVALSEVQAYGYAAAMGGADLLEAFGRSGAAQWRHWAAELADRFRDRFWLSDADGRYPAVALDADGAPVDSVASNMGHLLGTGLLDRVESAEVARRLAAPQLSSGFGLRTLASSSAGFNPLSYHGGSVWTHDTAMAISGLAAAAADGVPGAAAAAAGLIQGILAAAPSFDYRMPELHGGARITTGGRAVPYPASCRPQAWAAASSLAILSAVIGTKPDAPNDKLEFVPLRPSPVGELTVSGLRFAGRPLRVELAADGTITGH